MTRLQVLEKALEESLHLFGLLRHKAYDDQSAGYSEQGILAAERALRPPPEMETVGITQYSVYTPKNGGCLGTYHTEEEANRVMCPGFELVKLTGSYQRPKKQPVEKSISVEAEIRPDGVITSHCSTPIQPFMQHPECHGKAVTLTATWTE